MKKILSVIVLITMITLFMVGGCGSNEISPSETANQFALALQESDEISLQKIYNSDVSLLLIKTNNEPFGEEASKIMSDKIHDFDFEITGEKINNNDTAVVSIDITAYNLGAVMEETVNEYMGKLVVSKKFTTKEQMKELIIETFVSNIKEIKKDYQQHITLNLIKIDGIWRVDSNNQSFRNAISGNAINIIAAMSKDTREL
jgi:hypothetical protein